MKNNRFNFLGFTVATILLLPLAAFTAGSGGGADAGGGHVVSCKGQPTLALDYFDALDKVKNKDLLLDPESDDFEVRIGRRLNDFGFMTTPTPVENSEMLEFANDFLGRVGFGNWFTKRLSEIGPIENWRNDDLKTILDFNLIYQLPSGCVGEQAAAQVQNGTQINMFKNPKIMAKLSVGQKRVLRVHEVLYSLVRENLGTTSEQVRTLLETLLLDDLDPHQRDLATERFMSSIKNAGHKFVCSAVTYAPISYGSRELVRDSGQEIKAFGRSMDEAFSNLMKNKSEQVIPCNKLEISDGYFICTAPPSVVANCSANR